MASNIAVKASSFLPACVFIQLPLANANQPEVFVTNKSYHYKHPRKQNGKTVERNIGKCDSPGYVEAVDSWDIRP